MGRRSLAVVESPSGVTVTADGSVWDGSPKNLVTEVTPVWVTLQNGTGRPFRVQYDEFTLRGTSGASYIALAPYALRASRSNPVTSARSTVTLAWWRSTCRIGGATSPSDRMPVATW